MSRPPDRADPEPSGGLRRTAVILVLALTGAGLEWIPDSPSPWRWLPLAVVYLVGAGPIARESWAALRRGRLSVDALMGIAALGAALVGQPLEGAILIFLFTLSNELEGMALGRTRNAIQSLLELRPEEASPLQPDGTEGPPVPVETLEPGQRIRVRPGERVPVDGRVVEGRGNLDQSAITGESIPVGKTPGDEVFAATILSGGSLVVEVTRPASESLVARIIALVEEARENRAPAQTFIDRFAHPYTLGVIVVTAGVAVIPPLFGWAEWGEAFYRSMTLLVVASPCALIISTPAAILSGIANGARHGVLFKGGGILDLLGQVDVLAFDKTGTLTLGRPGLEGIHPATGDSDSPDAPGVSPDDLLRWTASLELPAEHHLATALLDAARDRGLELLPVDDFEAIPGEGIRGRLRPGPDASGASASRGPHPPHSLWVGNEAMAARHRVSVPESVRAWQAREGDEGRTVILVGSEHETLGAMSFADQLRPSAAENLRATRAGQIRRIVVLSGDHPAAVRSQVASLDVDEVHGGLLPPQKVEAVEALTRSGSRVAMVGDGVNDAPAMAAASVGIAMGAAGTDVAIETADVVLMADDLGRVHYALELARRSRRVVQQNVYFSVGWMALLVLVAGTVGMPLSLAVVAHEGSTLLVVLNGLRLLR